MPLLVLLLLKLFGDPTDSHQVENRKNKINYKIKIEILISYGKDGIKMSLLLYSRLIMTFTEVCMFFRIC